MKWNASHTRAVQRLVEGAPTPGRLFDFAILEWKGGGVKFLLLRPMSWLEEGGTGKALNVKGTFCARDWREASKLFYTWRSAA